MNLDYVQNETACYLEEIKRLFKAGAKISVFVRFDRLPERDFVMTDDDLEEVKTMISRRQSAQPRSVLNRSGEA